MKNKSREMLLQTRISAYLDKLENEKKLYWCHPSNVNKKGIPDYLVCIRGTAHFIEVKDQHVLTPMQIAQQNKMHYNASWWVAKGFDSFVETIKKIDQLTDPL